MDWTEFDADDHSTLVISLQTNHGRSNSLLWKNPSEIVAQKGNARHEESCSPSSSDRCQRVSS